MPGEGNDDHIDYGDRDEPDRGVKDEEVRLIEDKEREDDESDRIVPELAAQETDDEPELHGTVADQVESGKMLFADREVLRRLEKVMGDDVVRILGELAARDEGRERDEELLGYEKSEQPPGHLHERIHAFQDEAYVEHEADIFFFHIPGIMSAFE